MSSLNLDDFTDLIERPDGGTRRDAEERRARFAVPPGALGRLDELGEWLSAAQAAVPVKPLERPRVVLFAGDHGIAELGVSARPAGGAAALVRQAIEGASASAILARRLGVGVRVVDMALDCEPDELPAVTWTANGSFDANLWNVCNWPGSTDRGTASTRSEVVAVGVVVTTAAPPSVGAASEFGSDGVTVGVVVVVDATTLTGAGFWFNIFIVFGTSMTSSATSTTAPPIAIFFCLAAFAFATSCFEARFAMVMGLLPRTGRSAA